MSVIPHSLEKSCPENHLILSGFFVSVVVIELAEFWGTCAVFFALFSSEREDEPEDVGNGG